MRDVDVGELTDRATAAAQTWAPGCWVENLESMEGGTISVVFGADVIGGRAGDERVVLKVAPPGLPPTRNRDVLRQARCIEALSRADGVGVPAVLFSDAGEPNDIPPFFASGLVAGECAEPLLDAERNRRPDDIVRGRAFGAARMLAALHRAVPTDIGLDEPVTTIPGEIDRWTAALDTSPAPFRSGYERAAEALHASAPSPVAPVVVHGDYRLGNMLSEGTEVRAIIDWEIWSVSDPRVDLSWFLFFTEEAEHPVVTPGVDSGMPSDDELLETYEQAVGATVVDLGWFHALTRYKEAAAMALIGKHAMKRDPQSDMVERFSVLLPAMIADAYRRVS